MTRRDNLRSKGIVQWLSDVTDEKTSLGSLGIDSRLWAQSSNTLTLAPYVCVRGKWGILGNVMRLTWSTLGSIKISFSAVCGLSDPKRFCSVSYLVSKTKILKTDPARQCGIHLSWRQEARESGI